MDLTSEHILKDKVRSPKKKQNLFYHRYYLDSNSWTKLTPKSSITTSNLRTFFSVTGSWNYRISGCVKRWVKMKAKSSWLLKESGRIGTYLRNVLNTTNRPKYAPKWTCGVSALFIMKCFMVRNPLTMIWVRKESLKKAWCWKIWTCFSRINRMLAKRVKILSGNVSSGVKIKESMC